MNPATIDVVVNSSVDNPNRKLHMMVAAINIARHEVKDPELKLMFQKILRAGGVTVDDE